VHQGNTRLLTQRSPCNAIPEQLTLRCGRAPERRTESNRGDDVPRLPALWTHPETVTVVGDETFATCCNGFLKSGAVSGRERHEQETSRPHFIEVGCDQLTSASLRTWRPGVRFPPGAPSQILHAVAFSLLAGGDEFPVDLGPLGLRMSPSPTVP